MIADEMDLALGRSVPPFGYCKVDGLWWPDGDEVQLLRVLYILAAGGHEHRAIASCLNGRCRHIRWTADRVTAAVRRSIHKGEVLSCNNTVTWRLERLRIVSDDLWHRANHPPKP